MPQSPHAPLSLHLYHLVLWWLCVFDHPDNSAPHASMDLSWRLAHMEGRFEEDTCASSEKPSEATFFSPW